MLDIRVSEKQQVAVVEVQGRIDSATAVELGKVLTGVIDDGHHQIVLDIGGVDYMSSAGLRELVAALKKLEKVSGDMRMAQVAERVYDVMEIPGLTDLIKIFDSQVEAVNSF